MATQIEHSEQCVEAQRIYAAYVAQWPDHCRPCCASGVYYFAGNYEQPAEYDTCSHCMERSICPRCGKSDALAEETDYCLCQFCQWTPDDVAPIGECFCGEDY